MPIVPLFGAKCGICIREEKNLVFQIDIMMNLHLLKCNKKCLFWDLCEIGISRTVGVALLTQKSPNTEGPNSNPNPKQIFGMDKELTVPNVC